MWPFRNNEPWKDGPPPYPGFQAYPRILYHPKLARDGKRFETPEHTRGLQSRGWYDNPGKFPKPSALAVYLQGGVKPWWDRWQWLVAAIGILTGTILGVLKVIEAIHLPKGK